MCPYCKRKQQNYAGAIILVIVFLFLFNVARNSGTHNKNNNVSNKNTNYETIKEESNAIEYIEITAADMIKMYQENEVKCKQTFENVPLKITGTIHSINVGYWGDSYIVLEKIMKGGLLIMYGAMLKIKM